MDSDAGPSQPRSGGKIVRPRRRFAVRTPYDRPAPRSRDPPQQNPSWISRLVYKPVTVIASGAGKFISSVVFSESSSSSSEDEDSSSDIEGDEDIEKNITDFPEDETMVEESSIQRLGSKRVIEQLLMQETFAREEGNRLIDIIKARVVDHPSLRTPNEGKQSDNEMNVGETSNKAVMEAKRWLEEKKSASKLKSIATEDGSGSPVDVAKSYMQARLPWGSPGNNSEFRSPSPAGVQLLKEGTPFPYSAGNFSSSKLRRRSRSNHTWNIQDEIRKVRAKATEEMLKTVSPSNVASLDVGGGVQAVRIEQSVPNPSVPTTEQDQTTEANHAVEETRVIHTRSRGLGLDKTFASTQGAGVDDSNDVDNDFIQPTPTTGEATDDVLAPGATLDPSGSFCIPKDVFETSKEADDDDIGAARPIANGFPSSSPSSPVANEAEASEAIVETPGGDDITVGNGLDGPIDNNENNDSDSSASHNSSSTHEKEWLPGDQSLPNSNSASSSPGTSKVLAPTRRGGRGRGRGRGRGVRGKGRGK